MKLYLESFEVSIISYVLTNTRRHSRRENWLGDLPNFVIEAFREANDSKRFKMIHDTWRRDYTVLTILLSSVDDLCRRFVSFSFIRSMLLE